MSKLTALITLAGIGLAGTVHAEVAGDRAPDAPAPEPAVSRSAALLDHLPIEAGPVPGTDAITIKIKPSTKHCGGVAARVKIRRSRRVQAPDPDLAVLFALEFPTDLDFDPKRTERREKSMKKFNAWFRTAYEGVIAAVRRYQVRIDDAAIAPLDKLAALGRLAVALRWSAAAFVRAEIPKNILDYPEAPEIWCDMVAAGAEPLVSKLDQTTAACRELATQLGAGAGWWDAACAASPASP